MSFYIFIFLYQTQNYMITDYLSMIELNCDCFDCCVTLLVFGCGELMKSKLMDPGQFWGYEISFIYLFLSDFELTNFKLN